MQHLYLVRHRTTEWMDANKIQGSTDSPLSPKGKAEAERTAQALKEIRFDAVYCSPMGRARETAGFIGSASGITPTILDDLREMNFGWYEGSSYFDAPGKGALFFERLGLLAKILIAQISGEPLAHVKKRAFESWEEIRQRCPQGKILVVAHGVIINFLLNLLLTKEEYDAIKPVHFKPCCITELIVDDDHVVKLLRLNDTDHLKNMN